MKTPYDLPPDALQRIFERDQTCVYCHRAMTDHDTSHRGVWRTIEHLRNSPPWDEPENVVICCWSCNSSKGTKPLLDWFATPYCLSRNINERTVAEPVRAYLRSLRDGGATISTE